MKSFISYLFLLPNYLSDFLKTIVDIRNHQIPFQFLDVKFKLTVINPSLVVGPLLHNVQGTSVNVKISLIKIYNDLNSFYSVFPTIIYHN